MKVLARAHAALTGAAIGAVTSPLVLPPNLHYYVLPGAIALLLMIFSFGIYAIWHMRNRIEIISARAEDAYQRGRSDYRQEAMQRVKENKSPD